MAVLGVDEHRFLGLPDGALTEHDEQGLALVRPAARRRPARHDPHVRPRRHDVPSRPHRRAPLGDQGLGAARPPRPPALRHVHDRAPARFGELYEEWGVYMTDERPAGAPADELAVDLTLEGASSTASSPPWRRWRRRPGLRCRRSTRRRTRPRWPRSRSSTRARLVDASRWSSASARSGDHPARWSGREQAVLHGEQGRTRPRC